MTTLTYSYVKQPNVEPYYEPVRDYIVASVLDMS